MRRATTLLFLLYLAILTVGLLVSNPFAIAGSREFWLREVYVAYIDPVAHFVLFSVLGLLAYGSRWPARLAVRMALVVVYAVATEGLQHFVPQRTPELKDVLQNLAGTAVGAALGWMLLGRRRECEANETSSG